MRRLLLLLGVWGVSWSCMGFTVQVHNTGCTNLTVQIQAYINGNLNGYALGVNGGAVGSMSVGGGAATVDGTSWVRLYYLAVGACPAYDSGHVSVGVGASSFSGDVGSGCGTGCGAPCPVTADNPTGSMHTYVVGVSGAGPGGGVYQMYQNGVPMSGPCGSGGPRPSLGLNPGGSGTMTVVVCDTNGIVPVQLVGDWGSASSGSGTNRVCWYEPLIDGYVRPLGQSEYGVSDSYGSAGSPGTGGGVGGPGSGFTDGPNNSGTNGIGWGGGGGGTNAAGDGTLRTGFSALYSVNNQQLGDLSRIENTLYDIRSDVVAVTNLLGQVVAGQGDLTNYVGQTVGLLRATTNLLGLTASRMAGLSNMMIFGTNQLGLISKDLASISNSLVFGTNQLGLISGDLGSISNSLVFGTNQLGLISGDLESISNSLVFGTNQLGLISGDLGSISNSLVFGTNQLGLVTDNLAGISNLMVFGSNQWGFASSNLSGISNLLSGLFTNDLSGISTAGTNADSAVASALSQPGVSGLSDNFDTIQGHIDGAADGAGGLAAGGSFSMFSFAFCGTTLNLDPEARFPGFMGLVKNAWSFIVLFLFGMWAGPWVLGLVRTYATVETGGVPEVNGLLNIGGMVAAVLVPVAFIALFVGLFTICISGLLTQLDLLPSAASALSLGGNQGALYLLNSSFPVSLALSCGFARMGLPFTAAKLGFVAASAARFLWGK